MRLVQMVPALVLCFATSAHADWRDKLKSLILGQEQSVEAPPAASLRNAYLYADAQFLFESSKKIVEAVDAALAAETGARSPYSPAIAESLNDQFFKTYETLYAMGAANKFENPTVTAARSEAYRQLDLVYRGKHSVPPVVAGRWTTAIMSLELWYRTGNKPQKFEKPDLSVMDLLIYENQSLREIALLAYSRALDQQLRKCANSFEMVGLLTYLANEEEYYAERAKYSAHTEGVLVGDNEWSTFASSSIGVALDRLAQIDSLESWKHFLLAFTQPNIKYPEPHYALHEYMGHRFLEAQSTEKIEALKAAQHIIETADLKGEDHKRRRQKAIGEIKKMQAAVWKEMCGQILRVEGQ